MTESVSNKKFFIAASPLFLILFIDSMGLGLVVPLLNALLIDPTSGFLTQGYSINFRNFIFGSTMGIFMLCWFFGASFLGDLSDQIGRKKSLQICLIGALFGYLLSAAGVMLNSFALLILGRMIAGFTAGSQSIAQAAIIDISPAEHKARNLGIILFFISLGFVFGPLLGGLFSNKNLLSWFNYTTPFYFAAFLSLLNLFLLKLLFIETFRKTGKLKIKLYHSFEIFISAFRHEKIRNLSITFLIMIFGWSGFYSFISMFLTREYHFNMMDISLYMTLMGLGFGIGTGFLVDYCTRYFSLKNNVLVGSLVSCLAALITVAMPQPIFAWCAVLPLSIAMAVVYSVLLTIFSNQVDENSQGWIMGITGAMMAAGSGINGIIVGVLADFSPKIPLIITVIGLGLTALLMQFFHNGNKIKL